MKRSIKKKDKIVVDEDDNDSRTAVLRVFFSSCILPFVFSS